MLDRGGITEGLPFVFAFEEVSVVCDKGPIAQLVERSAHNRLVLGSSPGGPTILFSELPSSPNLGYLFSNHQTIHRERSSYSARTAVKPY